MNDSSLGTKPDRLRLQEIAGAFRKLAESGDWNTRRADAKCRAGRLLLDAASAGAFYAVGHVGLRHLAGGQQPDPGALFDKAVQMLCGEPSDRIGWEATEGGGRWTADRERAERVKREKIAAEQLAELCESADTMEQGGHSPRKTRGRKSTRERDKKWFREYRAMLEAGEIEEKAAFAKEKDIGRSAMTHALKRGETACCEDGETWESRE